MVHLRPVVLLGDLWADQLQAEDLSVVQVLRLQVVVRQQLQETPLLCLGVLAVEGLWADQLQAEGLVEVQRPREMHQRGPWVGLLLEGQPQEGPVEVQRPQEVHLEGPWAEEIRLAGRGVERPVEVVLLEGNSFIFNYRTIGQLTGVITEISDKYPSWF